VWWHAACTGRRRWQDGVGHLGREAKELLVLRKGSMVPPCDTRSTKAVMADVGLQSQPSHNIVERGAFYPLNIFL